MDQAILEKARFIYGTIQMIKQTMMVPHCAIGSDHGAGSLTIAQVHTLMVVRALRSVSIKGLSDVLRVSPPSASAMVERLVESDLVSREHGQVDRRTVEVRLTSKGEESIRKVEEEIFHSIAELLERLGPEYTEKWCDVYRRIRAVLANEFGGTLQELVEEDEVRQ